MKKIITAILCLSIYSCTDQLELEPISSIGETSFFRNAAEVEAGVIASYDGIQNTIQREYMLTEVRSDNSTVVAGSGSEFIEIDEFRDNQLNGLVANYWATAYNAITRTNTVLRYLDRVEDPARQNQFEGEVRFIRGYIYFNLVRLFGDVPLVLEDTPADENSYARVNESQVYESIISDFETAITNLNPTSDDGRATASTARGMLAKVYLTMGAYGSARPLLEEVINSGNFELEDSYADVFALDNELNDEILFAIQFKAGANNEGNDFSYEMSDKGPFGALNRPTVDMVDAYAEADNVRRNTVMPADGERLLIKYANEDNPNDGGNDWLVLRYADILLMYAEVLNEEGDQQEAVEYVNMIRERAYGDDSQNAEVADQDTVREIIRHERRIELAFENHRWFDLLRYGNAVEVMNEHLSAEFGNARMKEHQVLFAIPQREIDVSNGMLEQNSGYN